MSKKKTHEEYVAEVAVINPNVEVIGTYVNAKTKVLFKCKADGCEWTAFPCSILQNHGCPKCGGTIKKTHDEYVSEVARINSDIEVVGIYVNNKTNILHRCKVDGYEWNSRPYNILSGKGCPRCANKEKYTQEEYIKRVARVNADIEVVGTYVNAITPLLHRCRTDGYEWRATPNSILCGSGCPKCGGSMKATHEEYVDSVIAVNSDIEVVGTYVNNKTKILHRCKVDGCEWMALPNNILAGHGCPKCNYSKGERIVANWLNKKNILYKPQKTFSDCKDKQVLPFDFYLPDHNIAIEYNGKQHYEPIDYFGGQEAFEYVVGHDNIKREYCKNNNITLFTIPYFADVYEELEKMYELIMNKEAIA